ncbi:AlpA family transcriptional regulator [bacterium]|nr:MAG: AlpA family transcriptional regulator [bacterium]
MNTILRLPTVMKRTGLPKSTLYKMVRAKQFPQPIRLSTRSVGWVEGDVDCWIQQRIETTHHVNE